jgi:hypothetical protein
MNSPRRPKAGQGISIVGDPVPVPGAAPTTSPNFLPGIYALATINGTAVLNLFDGEVHVTQDTSDVTGHGDEWHQMKPLRQRWTARLRGYMVRSATAAQTYIGGGSAKAVSGPELTLTVYSDYGTTAIFVGTCYAEEMTINLSDALVEQEFNLVGNSTPTTGPS